LTGALAQHLDPSDPKVPVITNKLIDTLKIPSEHVQSAVAECLPALVKMMKDGKNFFHFFLLFFFFPFFQKVKSLSLLIKDAPALIQKMLNKLVDGKNYGERRGAVSFYFYFYFYFLFFIYLFYFHFHFPSFILHEQF